MKYLRQLFAALLIICSTVTFAKNVEIDGIAYDIDTQTKVATVIAGGNYTGDVVIPETVEYNSIIYNVTGIGDSAFIGQMGLTSIIIPNSVTSIGKEAFRNCGLTNITIGNGITSIGNSAFSACHDLVSATIPNSVTKIGQNVFNDCWRLTSVMLPNDLTKIPNGMFSNCSSLTNITIPNSVTLIDTHAFWACSSLTEIEIPNSVTSIYENAFAHCKNLVDFYCRAMNVPSTDENAFSESYLRNMTLHVPDEAVDHYKTSAPWSSFGTITAIKNAECARPLISYSNGELRSECKTPNAKCVTEVTCSDAKHFYENRIKFSTTYNICVYATALGYENSETANATFCWIENDNGENDATGIVNIPATATLITSTNGTIAISCSLDGETAAVYTTSGELVGTTTFENGSATISTGLPKGTIVIVQIRDKNIKIAVQ